MQYLCLAIKMILFFIFTLGYWELCRRRIKISIYYIPIFTVLVQMTILFIMGILNMLLIGAVFIYGFGCVILIRISLRDGNIRWIRNYINVEFIFLFFILCMAAVALKGAVFYHYDNFSHWAIMVKEMLKNNRYPNFADDLIFFKAYPPGSATYIYYFCKMTGCAEGMQMLAQTYMILTGIFPIFSFFPQHQQCKKIKRNILFIYITVFTNFVLVYLIQIYDLLVDTLLPVVGISAILFIHCGGGQNDNCNLDEDGEKILLCTVPFITGLMLIKNAGVYFVFIICMMVGIRFYKSRKGLRETLLVIFSPILVYILWKSHIDYVFENASLSKAAMTVEYLSQGFSGKTREQLFEILTLLLRFSVSGSELWILSGFIIVIGAFTWICKRKFILVYLKFFLISFIVYISWMAGLLLTYFFSMPTDEALILAGASRYRMTIFIFIYYLMSIYTIKFISALEPLKKYVVAAAASIVILCISWYDSCDCFATLFQYHVEVEVQERYKQKDFLNEVIVKYNIPEGKSYVIATTTAKSSNYIWWVARYLLESSRIYDVSVTEKEEMNEFINYDYLICLDDSNEIIDEWIGENYPEQRGRKTIVLH